MGPGAQLFILLSLMSVCCGGRYQRSTRIESNDIDAAVHEPVPSAVKQNLNDTVDLMLEVLQETLVKTNHTSIPLPDFEEAFTKVIDRIKIRGKVTGQKGWFKNLATVRRTGDATMTQSGQNLTVSIAVGLAFMELGYDYLHVKVEDFSATCNVVVDVKTNAVFVQVNVVMFDGGKCNLTLQELKITQLDGLNVHVKGLKTPFNWLVSQVATVVSLRLKDKIRKEVEDHVIGAVQGAMDKFHC